MPEQNLAEENIHGQTEAAGMTLRSFVDDYWKPYLCRKQTKPSTLRGYQSVLDNHILLIMDDMLLTDIKPINVEELLLAKAKSSYAQRTMRNIVVQLNGILHLAEDDDLIGKSPVRDRHKPVVRKIEKPIWTPEQVRMIPESVPTAFRCLFICVAMTGLRLGERLALQWKYVDRQSKTLQVARSLWKKQLVSPKTATSARYIPLGDVLIDALAAHRRNSLFTNPEDFVFRSRNGSPRNKRFGSRTK